MRSSRFCSVVFSISALFVLTLPCRAPAQLWWERGADRWYYKDDWKGLVLSGGRSFEKTIPLEGRAASGWIVVWGRRGYRLLVNEMPVGSSVDEGLIDDYDLTPYLMDRSGPVVLRIEGDSVCGEGEIVGRDGARHPFATDGEWMAGRGRKARAKKPAPGPSTGAFHSAHNGRLLMYNEEERGKAAIAKALARIQKMNDQGIYLLRRFRPAREIISFDPETPWRRSERLAAPLLKRAGEILTSRAIPAQKEGRFSDAISLAAGAADLISAAEAPVMAATGIYRAEREITHLKNFRALLEGHLPAPDRPSLDEDLSELRSLSRQARRSHRLGDWASAEKAIFRHRELARGIRERLEEASRKAFGDAATPTGALDSFPLDPLGWLNARRLMGNDPGGWQFSVLPPASSWIDLAGRWDFRIDPDNAGEERGWAGEGGEGWMELLVPGPWERQGIREDHLKSPRAPLGKGTTGTDKPYNGFAWYRKSVRVPASWKGKTLMLSTGVVENWGRIFWNRKPIGTLTPPGVEDRRLRKAGRLKIPAELVRFGEENRIAIQVYNHDNFGGIIRGPIAIYPEGGEPDLRETPGPLSIVQELTYPVPGGKARCAFLAGALSPGVIVSADGNRLEIRGWEAKGYPPPDRVQFQGRDGARSVTLGKSDQTIFPAGGEMAGNWFLLRGEQGITLVVPVQGPRSITWRKSGTGGMGLLLDFPAAPAGLAILCLPPRAKTDLATCRFWERALRRYPVAASELVIGAKSPSGPQAQKIRYSYLELPPPEGGTDIHTVAPVPMLLSFALEHGHPGLKVQEARTTGYRSEFAAYRVVENATTLAFSAPPVERGKVMKGFGELFARGRVEDNVHGGLGEREMFRRAAEWGFDHCRYAMAFNAKWDLPLVEFMGGPIIENNEARWERLDRLVENCNAAGIQMMLCSFSEIRSRRWKEHPEEERNCFELWRRFARRYAHLPAWAISYDFFNEPAHMNIDHWKRIMKELTAIIRSEDRKHTIVWESADGWAQPHWCYWMEPVDDPNVIYSFHHYGKHWGYAYDEYYPSYQSTRERKMLDVWLEAILFGLRYNVPIHCGEFGISMIQPGEDGKAWLNDYLALFERFGIGWNWWNYSGGNIYRTGLAAGDRISPYVPILRKWMDRSGWGPRPAGAIKADTPPPGSRE